MKDSYGFDLNTGDAVVFSNDHTITFAIVKSIRIKLEDIHDRINGGYTCKEREVANYLSWDNKSQDIVTHKWPRHEIVKIPYDSLPLAFRKQWGAE